MTRRRRTLKTVPGYVWCSRYGAIHDDTLNPYDLEPCNKVDHRPVLVFSESGEEF